MDRPKLEMADVFRLYGDTYRQQHAASLSTAQRRVMTAIEVCRTAALGGYVEQCDSCSENRSGLSQRTANQLAGSPTNHSMPTGPRGGSIQYIFSPPARP
jgi:hypothetical protein